jgi:hypothetical protein
MKETLISKVFSSNLITNSIYSTEDIVIDVRHLWVYRFVISSSSIISSPFPYFPLKRQRKSVCETLTKFP